VVPSQQKLSDVHITADLHKLYQLYFGSPLGYQDKEWAPRYVQMDYVTA